MTKSTLIIFGLVALLTLPAALAQDSSALAVNQAVLNQANQILLRNKLVDAKAAAQHGDILTAAKLYQESFALAREIGSGIVDNETARALAGLVSTRLTLAREAQVRGDLREAALQVDQVLKADPKNNEAILFKQGNDRLIGSLRGQTPDAATLEQLPQIISEKTQAGTLVQDGKVLYEAGKLEDAEVKLKQALKLDGDNGAAYYYLNLIKEAKYARASALHTVDNEQRMASIEKRWVLPVVDPALPVPNPYAKSDLVHTGPGRQAIIAKMNHIRFENLAFEGVPLSEVLRVLSEKTRLSDPEHKGINFMINPNPDQSGAPVPSGGGGKVDPATGLPPSGGGGGDAGGDLSNFTVKLNLADVSLNDALDAILMVAQNPAGDGRMLKFSITDYAIMFQVKGAESPQMFMRTFRVDPNTFYSGLQNVTSLSFAGGNSGGNSGGKGGNSGGNNNDSSGGNGSSSSTGLLGIVDAFGGSSVGGSGGGGKKGAKGDAGGDAGGGAGADANAKMGSGGLAYVASQTSAVTPSELARTFFTTLGVNLTDPVGKSVFFNDRLGLLFVRATEQDLDIIERAIEALNKVSPQVHIKTRFVEVQQGDNKALGFDWYLGQFNMGGNNSVVGQGGNGSFPAGADILGSGAPYSSLFNGGSTTPNVGSFFNSGLNSASSGGTPAAGATTATITGILSNPQFQVVINALESRSGVEELAEPEVTTTSGRQTQMKAAHVVTVITGVDTTTAASNSNTNGILGGSSSPQTTFTFVTQAIETGPLLDVVPYVLSDGYTINLALIPSLTEFNGYDTLPANAISSASSFGGAQVAVSPVVLPDFTVRQVVTTVNVWDNQTVVLGGLISSTVNSTKSKVPMLGDIPLLGQLFQSQSKTTDRKNLMIFVTATIVDPAGNRVHSDDELPFAQASIPAQPPGAGKMRETVKQVHSLPPANP